MPSKEKANWNANSYSTSRTNVYRGQNNEDKTRLLGSLDERGKLENNDPKNRTGNRVGGKVKVPPSDPTADPIIREMEQRVILESGNFTDSSIGNSTSEDLLMETDILLDKPLERVDGQSANEVIPNMLKIESTSNGWTEERANTIRMPSESQDSDEELSRGYNVGRSEDKSPPAGTWLINREIQRRPTEWGQHGGGGEGRRRPRPTGRGRRR